MAEGERLIKTSLPSLCSLFPSLFLPFFCSSPERRGEKSAIDMRLTSCFSSSSLQRFLFFLLLSDCPRPLPPSPLSTRQHTWLPDFPFPSSPPQFPSTFRLKRYCAPKPSLSLFLFSMCVFHSLSYSFPSNFQVECSCRAGESLFRHFEHSQP